jgi:hypothetical protein
VSRTRPLEYPACQSQRANHVPPFRSHRVAAQSSRPAARRGPMPRRCRRPTPRRSPSPSSAMKARAAGAPRLLWPLSRSPRFVILHV